ncbi:iron transporter [Halopiger thermotolerans]
MRRRDALRLGAVGTVGGAALATLAGRLESLRREDAWRRLVVDPPEGIYVPPKIDEMVAYGTETVGGREIAVLATRPHSFWTVTGDERTRADLRSDHSLHLMVRVRDVETNTIVPTSVTVAVRRHRGGERVDRRTLWPMLSQRMGFHYGDNVALAGDGTYEAMVRVGGADCRTGGALAERLERPVTTTIALEYAADEIKSLERTLIDADERDAGDALEPMGSADGDRDRPAAVAPPFESLPGDRVGVETGDDVRFPAVVVDGVRGVTDAPYLAVVPQTASNGYVLPFASLSVAGLSGERTAFDEPARETIAPELGHHYGLALEGVDLDRVDGLSFALEPPQLARHEGYETAFLERERVRMRVRPTLDGDRDRPASG